jgi:hypothetical protein
MGIPLAFRDPRTRGLGEGYAENTRKRDASQALKTAELAALDHDPHPGGISRDQIKTQDPETDAQAPEKDLS